LGWWVRGCEDCELEIECVRWDLTYILERVRVLFAACGIPVEVLGGEPINTFIIRRGFHGVEIGRTLGRSFEGGMAEVEDELIEERMNRESSPR